MKKHLCGIDGGGTVTSVLVCDHRGHKVSSFTAGTLNHYGVGLARVQETYREIRNRLLEETGQLPDAVYIGSSALDDKASPEEAHEITGGVFDNSLLEVHSDVYIALLGFSLGKSGAIVVSGTGSMACGVNVAGIYTTAGGWGHTLGDEGSGYHLGLKGIQAALRGFDGIAPATQLTDKVVEFYQVGSLSGLIDLVYNPPIEKSRIAAFAPEVEKAALAGDAVAQELLDREIDWLYKLAVAISHKCQTQKVGLHGGLVTKSATIGARLTSRLKEIGMDVGQMRFSPEKGAVLGAFNLVGLKITDEVLMNLEREGGGSEDSKAV